MGEAMGKLAYSLVVTLISMSQPVLALARGGISSSGGIARLPTALTCTALHSDSSPVVEFGYLRGLIARISDGDDVIFQKDVNYSEAKDLSGTPRFRIVGEGLVLDVESESEVELLSHNSVKAHLAIATPNLQLSQDLRCKVSLKYLDMIPKRSE